MNPGHACTHCGSCEQRLTHDELLVGSHPIATKIAASMHADVGEGSYTGDGGHRSY